MNIPIFELLGKTVSFMSNFNPSANGCNNPKKPTTFGPRLCCILAITFLSSKVRYATPTNNGTIIPNDFNKTFKTTKKLIIFL